MNQHKSSSQLKSIAKGRLLGHYSTLIGATFIYLLIVEAISMVVASISDLTTMVGTVLYTVILMIVQILCSVFILGQNYMYLTFGRGGQCRFWHIFQGFKTTPDKAILAYLLLMVIEFICILPAFLSILFITYIYYTPALMMLVSFCAVISIVAYYYVYLRFALVMYLLVDYPDMSVIELFKASNEMMKGNKARLFYIMVSFIPIILLGIGSIGIGLLFLTPYMQMTYVQFYLDLQNCNHPNIQPMANQPTVNQPIM